MNDTPLPFAFLRTTEEAHAEAMARGARCRQCLFWGCGRGPVPSQVVPNAVAAVGGEAPGKNEILYHWNFVGESGYVLDAALEHGGQSREHTTVCNVIACKPHDQDVSFEDVISKAKRKADAAEAQVEALRAEAQVMYKLGRVQQALELEAEATELEIKQPPWSQIDPVANCRPRFERDLDETRAEVLIGVGKQALAAIERYARSRDFYRGDPLVMSQMHGAPVLLAECDIDQAQALQLASVQPIIAPGYAPKFLFGSYHPAFAMRDQRWMMTVYSNLRRAVEVGTRGYINWKEPDYLIAPTPARAVAFLDTLASYAHRGHPLEITIDLETCDPNTGKPSIDQHRCAVRCAGFGARINGIDYVLVIPFRHMDGTPWTYEQGAVDAMVRSMRNLIDLSPIAGHNVHAFDSEILLRPVRETIANVTQYADPMRGLMSVRRRDTTDTMMLFHCTKAQDMPKNLSFVARAHFEVPAWKTKEDVQSTDNADDQRLMIRCARDVTVTQRLLDPLRKEVGEAGNQTACEVDMRVGRILRDMSELGMCVDEVWRGRLSRVLNAECETYLGRWYELVGKKVNPRSVPQMQSLLYEEWKLEPVLTTDQKTVGWSDDENDYDFEPDEIDIEDASTGAGAIMALIDRGVSDAQRQALECVLEYKARDKPRSTSCDDMPVLPWPGKFIDTPELIPAEGALKERPGVSWIRPTWIGSRTPVGRSVCRRPGEQQRSKLGRKLLLPEGEVTINMRKIIRAAPGHEIVYSDLKQSHVRILAACAGIKRLYEAIQTGLNVHVLNASAMLADSESEIMDRYAWIKTQSEDALEYWKLVAKKGFFATAYGAIDKTQYKVMRKERKRDTGDRAFPNVTIRDIQGWIERIHRHYPELYPWQQSRMRMYEQTGYATTDFLFERRRYGPLDDNMIPNHSILANEGGLKQRWLIAIDEAIQFRSLSDWTGIIGDFHDSVAVQVPIGYGAQAKRIVDEAMRYVWRNMTFEGSPKIVQSLGDG